MNIIIGMDSFKGSMTSYEAGLAVKTGIEQLNMPEHNVTVIPVADGGEGTIEALTYGKKVKTISLRVKGPLGKDILSKYVIVNDETAIIEIAEAAGLTLVNEELRNPLNTTTYGVGEMILHAMNEGCKKFIIGLGGSATNDCGIGMLNALGFDFTYKESKNVKYGAKSLKNISNFSNLSVPGKLYQCDFWVICDVDNPLVGENGCSRIFAPQKGASSAMVDDMDSWMNEFANLVEEKTLNLRYDRFTPGTGAAGGLGYAFLMFLNAKLLSGAKVVIHETGLENYIKASDLVIVGEGKMDRQSIMGKIPYAIATLAKKYDKRVIAFAGIVEDEAIVYETGVFDRIYSVERNGMSVDESMKNENAMKNLTQTVSGKIREELSL